MNTLRFDDRVAVVTGAGGNPGLGRSYALLLASRGAKVVVNDLGVGSDGRGAVGPGASAVVDEIRSAGGIAVANGDSVATRDSAKAVVDTALDEFGRVDIVINNAGIAPFALFDELSDSDIQRVVDVHLMGHIWMCRAAWTPMKDQGYGRIVNVSSGTAVLGMPYQSVYSGAKMGVVGLTRVLAAEGRAHGIVANTIMPTADTLAWQTMLDPQFSANAQARGLLPDVVAPVAAWLAHEDCEFAGKVLQAGAGSVKELYFSQTHGSPPDPHLDLDHVGAAIERSRDRSASIPIPDPTGEIPAGMVRLADKPAAGSLHGG